MEHVAGTTELERDDSVHNAAGDVVENTAILSDYAFSDGSGTAAAGLIGSVMTLAIAGGAGFVIYTVKKKHAAH
ncbi:hypothetical protein SDC9_109034 [bioreactor metagenome]|uniref:PDGLE domain-containing protein n=1 Tax=bioreactor metagenome TaxID=1076179 RepID=A0A645BAU9_9ZZZZ